MPQLDENYLQEVLQVLQWAMDDGRFRTLFFSSFEEAMEVAQESGVSLSPRAIRALKRVTPDSLAKDYDLYVQRETKRGGKGADAMPAPPPDILYEESAAPARIVNTGFAPDDAADAPLSPNTILAADTEYYFWLEIGEWIQGSIETETVELPIDKLPPAARLKVVLFSFPNGIRLTAGHDVGELLIAPDGTVSVVDNPASPPVAPELLEKRLFFPVKMPPQSGLSQMRCNMYYRQTLVQSRLITVRVGRRQAVRNEQMLTAVADYTISHSLRGDQLEGMGENRLSLMLNDNGNGTHGFRFFGEQEFKNDAQLTAGELTDLITNARKAMRLAAWGSDEPYAPGDPYRYGGDLNLKRLQKDLVRFARRGYQFYDTLIASLAGKGNDMTLEELMMTPGQVQIASKEAAELVVPAAMFYDHPFDDGEKTNAYSLCPTFVEALETDLPLEETSCFQGECVSYDQPTAVCPSGFWGYRHVLGLPVSVKTAPDAPLEIKSPAAAPIVATAVSTDPAFTARAAHEARLQAMGLGWEYADNRDDALKMLKKTEAQAVYFYCHGGVHDNVPYLSLGEKTSARFTRANLRMKRIRWKEIRPLVFINGCHTTALSPEQAINLVDGFIEVSHAAGVIGTEITIFEPIATTFAEEFFQRFLQQTPRQTAGEAIRGARLKLLQQGNPLGLVYIPYVMPGLKVTSG